MDLSRKYGVGSSTVFRILRSFGIPSRRGSDDDKKDVRRSLTTKAESKIITLYKNGTVASLLAFKFNVSPRTIYETLARNGCERRPRGSGAQTPEKRKQCSERSKKRWSNAEIRRKYLPILLVTSFKTWDLKYRLITDKRYTEFRESILERDGNACVRCWSKDHLEIHHKIHRVSRPDLIFDPSNVETLCRSCHRREEANRRHAYAKARTK